MNLLNETNDQLVELVEMLKNANSSNIIALVAAIFSGIAAVSAGISCLLHYLNSKPRIKVCKSNQQEHYFFFNYNGHFYAAFALNIINATSVSGVIDDVALIYNKVSHYAEVKTIDLTSVAQNISFNFANQTVLLSTIRLKCPLTINGYSIHSGFFIVPDVPLPNNTKEFTANICLKIIGKRKTTKFKNVKFTLLPNDQEAIS